MNVSRKSIFEAFYAIIGICLFAALYYKEVEVISKLFSIKCLYANENISQWLVWGIPLMLFAMEIIGHQMVIGQKLRSKILKSIGWAIAHLPSLVILVLLVAKFTLESQHLVGKWAIVLLGTKYFGILFIILLGHEVFVHLVPVVKSFSWRQLVRQLFQYTNGCYPGMKVIISMCFAIVLLTTLINPLDFITHAY